MSRAARVAKGQKKANDAGFRFLTSGTGGRANVKTGAKLAYVASVVAASFTVSNLELGAQALSPGCVGEGRTAHPGLHIREYLPTCQPPNQ